MLVLISMPFWFLAALFAAAGLYATLREPQPPKTDFDPIFAVVLLPAASGFCYVAARICGLL